MNTIRLNTIGTPKASGGNSGGGGGGSASAMEYWDMTVLSGEQKSNLILLAGFLYKIPAYNVIGANTMEMTDKDLRDKVTAIATIPSTKIVMEQFGLISIAEIIAMTQFTPTLITEEEFYNLNA